MDREPSYSDYTFSKSDMSFCPHCDKHVYMLALFGLEPKGTQLPMFMICFDCKFIGQVGVGIVKQIDAGSMSEEEEEELVYDIEKTQVKEKYLNDCKNLGAYNLCFDGKECPFGFRIDHDYERLDCDGYEKCPKEGYKYQDKRLREYDKKRKEGKW